MKEKRDLQPAGLSKDMKISIDRKSQNNCPYEKGKYQLVGAELFHDIVSPFFKYP